MLEFTLNLLPKLLTHAFLSDVSVLAAPPTTPNPSPRVPRACTYLFRFTRSTVSVLVHESLSDEDMGEGSDVRGEKRTTKKEKKSPSTKRSEKEGG